MTEPKEEVGKVHWCKAGNHKWDCPVAFCKTPYETDTCPKCFAAAQYKKFMREQDKAV